jgi:nitroreductase
MNQIIQNMLDRRSTRAFRADQLKEEELQAILTAGLAAPSANNSQPWHITVIQDQGILNWIVEQNKEKMRQSDNPEVVQRGNDPSIHNFYHAPTVIVLSADQSRAYGKFDCANVTTQMALAAHSLDIGSCIIASFMQAFVGEQSQLLIEKLAIPQGFQPVVSLALGYKIGDLPPAKPRKENTVTYLR